MDIPHDALVIVADGRKMLLFRNEGDEQYPKLEVVTHDEKAKADFGTDAPGVRHDYGAGMQHSSGMEPTDHQQIEQDRFAAEVADLLKKRALNNDFSKLIVAAPPRTLGELRKHYHKEVSSRLVGEVAKDLAQMPTAEIEKVLQQN